LADRDNKGRFTKGHKPLNQKNPGGRPKRAVEEKYLRAFSRVVKVKDFEDILLTALSRAKAGDLGMVRLFFEYGLGKPRQRVELEGDVEFRFPKVVVFNVGRASDQPASGAGGDPTE